MKPVMFYDVRVYWYMYYCIIKSFCFVLWSLYFFILKIDEMR